jgi:hypothetical protein
MVAAALRIIGLVVTVIFLRIVVAGCNVLVQLEPRGIELNLELDYMQKRHC